MKLSPTTHTYLFLGAHVALAVALGWCAVSSSLSSGPSLASLVTAGSCFLALVALAVIETKEPG